MTIIENYSLASKVESFEKEVTSLNAQLESVKTQLMSSEKKVMILLQRTQGISGCSIQELEAALEGDGDNDLRLTNTLSELKSLREQLQEANSRCDHYKVRLFPSRSHDSLYV